LPWTRPCKRQRASSESSVIYPDPIFSNGPPPGISIHIFIYFSEAGSLINSKNEPHESAIKAPRIQPNALSVNSPLLIYCDKY